MAVKINEIVTTTSINTDDKVVVTQNGTETRRANAKDLVDKFTDGIKTNITNLTKTVQDNKTEILNTIGTEEMGTTATTIKGAVKELGSQMNENAQELETVKNDYAKKIDVNDLASSKAEKSDLESANIKISNLDSIKANKTEITTPFNFKGNCLSTELPASANVNDTWYCTDLKYRKTWNGSAWYQSSLEESDYTDELSSVKESLTNQKSLFDLNGNGITVLKGSFIYGNVESDGNIDPVIYRVSTNDILSYDRDFRLTIADGYKIILVLYSADGSSVVQRIVNITEGCNITANQKFKITIYKNIEDENKEANIYEFVSKVTLKSDTGYKIEDLYNKNTDSKKYKCLNKPYFLKNYNILTAGRDTNNYNPITLHSNYKYSGSVDNETRFMAIGYDDFSGCDLNVIQPIFEKYGYKATFNKILRGVSQSSDDVNNVLRTIYGGHEVGDHTFYHFGYMYTSPLWDGVNYPSNNDFRADRGDGKNVFGKLLTSKSLISETSWGDMSDTECQQLRDKYSLYKDTRGCKATLDALANKYLGIDSIFHGLSSTANHEVWNRIFIILQHYYLDVIGVNYLPTTWSMPGSDNPELYYEKDGKKYFDRECTIPANFLSRIPSVADGYNRSLTDVLRSFGYKNSHDYLYPTKVDGNEHNMMRLQYILNSHQSRKDCIPYPTNRTLPYMDAGVMYDVSFFSGNKPYPVQMYEDQGNYYDFIESVRGDCSNGIIHGELFDSTDNYGNRMLLEQMLSYCKATGIRVITKSEAQDICFNHKVYAGNLIFNPNLRNTAKEFMPNASNLPTNPDGYHNNCSVVYNSDNEPVLYIPSDGYGAVYYHYGIPYGDIKFSVEAKGNSYIGIYAIKNNSKESLNNSDLEKITQININNSDFSLTSTQFKVKNNKLEDYEEVYEGYGNKIIGLKIIYGPGLEVKNIKLNLI